MNFKYIATIILATIPTTFALASEGPEISGGLRYRYESIDLEDAETRNRHRIKANLGVGVQVEENLKFDLGLISGSSDPVSGNQTLDGAGSTKGFGLDRAEFSYKLPWSLTLHGGKMKNPFYRPGKTELIYDGDYRPEGLALKYKREMDTLKYGVTFGHFQIEERSGESDDTVMNGLQLFGKKKFGNYGVKLGASMYNYSHIKGQGALNSDDPTDAFGNALDGSNNYINDYEIQEIFAVFSGEVSGIPFKIFADVVVNAGADDNDSASLYGLRLGKAKKKGSWQFAYSMREIESDAVLAVFTDSDFKGGGTDGKGHELGFKYATSDKTNMALTHFMNETSTDSDVALDFNRTQLDFSLKF